MNMKKVLKFIPILILFIFLNIKVDASTCDGTTKKNLKQEAQHINVTAELQKPSTEPGAEKTLYTYDIRVLNVSKNLTYEIGSWIYNYADSANGELYVKNAYMMGGYKVAIKIYASNQTKCTGEVLRTIYVNLPRYNIYSDRKECEGLTEYVICKKTANTEKITEDQFLKKIEEAKKKKAEAENVKKDDEIEKDTFDFINFFDEHKNIIIPVAVIVTILLIILIIIKLNKNKKRIKIDLGDDLK